MYQTDSRQPKYVVTGAGQVYPYLEIAITQQESIYGFYLEVTATSLLLAVTPTSLLFGQEAMDPLIESADNTLHNVNGAAGATRIVGDINFDFTVEAVNRVFIQPSLVIGATTLPDIFQPVMGFYFKSDGLKILRAIKTRGN